MRHVSDCQIATHFTVFDITTIFTHKLIRVMPTTKTATTTTIKTRSASNHAMIAGVQVPPMAIGTSLDVIPHILFHAACDRVTDGSLGTWSWGGSKWGHKDSDMPKIREAWNASLAARLTFYDTA